MSVTSSALPRVRRAFSTIARSPTALWSAFVLTHLWLGFLNLTAPGQPLGDVVNQYKYWTEQADLATFYVGIDKSWVYPIVALIPMVIAGVFGFANYAGTWLSLVFLLDCIAFAALVGWRRPGRPVAIGWWWIAFLLLLGPIALGRIDSISVPIAIVAVLLLAARPKMAAFLLTIATWIKVWPAALIAAVVIASKRRVGVLITAAATSAVIIAVALALGARGNVFSFVTQQTARTLQIESPASTIWMWLSYFNVGGSFPYYDAAINTFEVSGPSSAGVAALLNPLLGLAVLVIAALGVVAAQRGATVTELLAPLALALVTALIAFNKVGSPQYMTWLVVPIILGLATRTMGHGRSFRFPAILALVAAGLTQVIYPYLYVQLIYLNLSLLVALTARNVLTVLLFAWAVSAVVGLTRPFAPHEKLDDSDAWLPSLWPFAEHPSATTTSSPTSTTSPTPTTSTDDTSQPQDSTA
ncbi:MAG TPA: glycosyltransferase 87 family protein [Galbitalea sp.]